MIKAIGLDSKEHKWSIVGYIDKIRDRSSLHRQVKNLLISLFPTCQILEEVMIPIRKGQKLYLDFFIPILKLAVEAHGQQHFEFNSHFYDSKADFLLAQKRDGEKREWCELNGITLIELNYNETVPQWRSKLESR